MPQKFANNARALLVGSLSNVATSLTVEAGKADRFPIANTSNWSAPADWFRATLIDSSGNMEIVKVGTRTLGSGVLGNLLRAQEGTTALAFTAGSIVLLAFTAEDVQYALGGVFAYLAAKDAADPKLEVAKTGTGSAAALFHMTAGKLTLAQSDGNGGITTDRFTFDQTNGTFTCADFTLTSDERLKHGWRALPKSFLARLSAVKRGIYRRKDAKGLRAGVGAQSLRAVAPWWVKEDDKGELSVNYAAAGLVVSLEVADALLALQSEVKALRARVKELER